jgi:PncC family amidohydrolase
MVNTDKGRLEETAQKLVERLTGKSLCMVTAESCTAGLAAENIAGIPGASACLWGSYVCYTRQAKTTMLGIGEKILAECGLVSGETARAMALGALEKSGVDAAVSVTGLAGPGTGDSFGKTPTPPVGTVWIATALRLGSSITVEAAEYHFSGSRNEVRQQAALTALEQMLIKIQ